MIDSRNTLQVLQPPYKHNLSFHKQEQKIRGQQKIKDTTEKFQKM